MWDRSELILFLERGHEDGAALAAWWIVRRWEIEKAIERHACDVDAIAKLFAVLGGDVPTHEHQEISEARKAVRLLDRLICGELVLSTGLLQLPKMSSRLCRIWLMLEVRFRPDERGWLAEVRDRLIRTAEHREIDLRGLGV